MAIKIQELLRASTVRIKRGSNVGSGFFIAPRLILTCAHVLGQAAAGELKVEQPEKDKKYKVSAILFQFDADYPDIALIETQDQSPHCVFLNDAVALGDQLLTYGYTDIEPNGESSTFTYEGDSNPVFARLLKFKLGQVRPGYSGSPLLNVATGGVCGIVKKTRDRSSLLGGRAIPLSTVFEYLPNLKAYHNQFVPANQQWQEVANVPEHKKRSPLEAVSDHYGSFSRLLIRDKTKDFVGRKFVFEELDAFLENNSRGYFLIKGDPGIGKSSIAATIVQRREALAHFIERKTVNQPIDFYKNVCTQAILAYHLPYDGLPTDFGLNIGFLLQLLEEAAVKSTAHEPVLVVIDALDELQARLSSTGNLLSLPLRLPDNVYIVATMRRGVNLRVDLPFQQLHIDQDSRQQLEDIKEYIRTFLNGPGIKKYIDKHQMDGDAFVELLAEKSQGNFMYLHHVLPEIGKGDYQDKELEALPIGLENYYEDHWERMKAKEGWLDYKLPILATLTITESPVSAAEISDFRDFNKMKKIPLALIVQTLEEWTEFLFEEQQIYNNQIVTGYRLYHSSYHDFVSKKNLIKSEQVNLEGTEQRFIDFILDDLDDFL